MGKLKTQTYRRLEKTTFDLLGLFMGYVLFMCLIDFNIAEVRVNLTLHYYICVIFSHILIYY